MSVNRTTVHSVRFVTSGRDQSWSPPMSSMQAEMAEAPFERDRITPWSRLRDASFSDWIVMLVVAAVIIVAVML